MSWRVPIYVLGGNNFSWECFSPFTEEKLSRDGLDQIIQNIRDGKHVTGAQNIVHSFSMEGLEYLTYCKCMSWYRCRFQNV